LFLKKLKLSRAKVLIVSSENEIDEFNQQIIFTELKNNKINFRLVRFSLVYGPQMPLKLLLENLFSLPQTVYPIFIDDLIYGLLKAMFSKDSFSKVYFLAGSEEMTYLEFKKMVQQIRQRKPINNFEDLKRNLKKESYLRTQTDLNWYPKIKLKDGLKQTLKWLEKNKIPSLKKPLLKEVVKEQKLIKKIKEKNIAKISVKVKNPKKLFKFKLKSFFKIIIIFVFVLLILLLPWFSFVNYCRQGQYQKAKMVLLEFNFLTFPFKKQRKQIFNLLDLGKNIQNAKNDKQKIIDNFYNLIKVIFQKKDGNIQEKINLASNYLEQVWQETNIIESYLTKTKPKKFSLLSFSLEGEIKEWQGKEKLLKENIILAREFLNILPGIINLKGKNNFLILIQDSSELRPTGGFLNSFGIISLEKGRLLDFNIKNVYLADSQLKGHIDPPESIKKYLGENDWHFRDSNWFPDFPASARQGEWFLEKEINKKVQGTIAVSLNFVKDLLKVFGPIQLKDNNEIITSENFLERNIDNAEIKFKGEKQKQDFISQVVFLLWEKIKIAKKEEWQKLIPLLKENLDKKQLLISLFPIRASVFFNQHGWDGSLRQQKINNNGLADYLMLVEANVAVNKSNFFLERKLKQETTFLKNGTIIKILTINFQNNSPSENKPGGDYKNYERIYAPLKSKLLSLEIGKNEKELIPIKESKIDSFQEYQKQGFGFLVNVPAQEKRIIKLIYKIDNKIVFKNNKLSYLFF